MNTDNQLVRAKLVETDDSGKRQTMQLTGRSGEQFGGKQTKVHRAQSYGFTGHVPKGGVGLVVVIGGNPDQAIAMDIEHPDHRPKDLAAGEVKIYDDQGQVIHLKRDGIHISTPKNVTITSGGTVHINP